MKNLNIQQLDAVELARKVGTPCIIYDESKIDQNMKLFRTSFQDERIACHVLYASKAFLCGALLEKINAFGLCLDVVSGGELAAAIHAKFPMEKIFFHGNNKTTAELQMALDANVGTIVVDNAQECEQLCQLAKHGNTRIMFRLNPGIEAHTHQYIVTAHIDSKFGISIQAGEEITRLVNLIEQHPNLHFFGFHAHIGSQIFDKNAYIAEVETLMNFIAKLEKRSHIHVEALNLGGGFAATYTKEDAPIPIPEVCASILEACHIAMETYEISLEHLMIEPGRSIVAEAGMSFYEVGWQKTTPHRNYVFVDGGMSDNIRPALYQASYSCDIANRMDEAKSELVSVAGKCCESGDILVEDVHLPKCEKGDILVVYTTGAYGYSMASNYNRANRPCVVFVKEGIARKVIERERYEDMWRLECDEVIEG